MNDQKKVLIITYYWPPSGGSGVQRWLKFVKYLPQFGWEPYVFTPENPAFDIRDESLLNDVPDEAEVIRFPIWEPYDIFLRLGGKREAKPTTLLSTQGRSFLSKAGIWMRGNLLVPDPRIFWVRPSAQFLESFLADNRIGHIITTGPPHSLHLIGYRLKKKNPKLKWFADFRDPWSEWGLLDSLNVTAFVRNIHRKLEARVLATADEVITITPFYKQQFERLGNRPVRLLTNGFDEDDFVAAKPVRSPVFVIRHVGIVNEKCNPRPFMEAVNQLLQEAPDFAAQTRIEFIGEVHPDFQKFVCDMPGVNNITAFTGNIPHEQLLDLYGSASLLLLVLHGYKDAEGYMPGKLFEYLATGLPVLGVGPIGGDAAAVLDETGAGVMLEGSDVPAIKRTLLEAYREWQTSPEPRVERRPSVARYSRRAITGELVSLMENRVKVK